MVVWVKRDGSLTAVVSESGPLLRDTARHRRYAGRWPRFRRELPSKTFAFFHCDAQASMVARSADTSRWSVAKVKTGDRMDGIDGQCGRSNADTGSDSRPGGTVTPLISPR
jgi:hypothetical protein